MTCATEKICIVPSHFQPSDWPRKTIEAIARWQFPWGWGEDETAIFSENNCAYTCGVAYIRNPWRRGSGIAGGKQGGHPFPPIFAAESERPVYQGLQRLCGGRRPFGLCDHPICQDNVGLYRLWLALECAVTESRRRDGVEILSDCPRPLQGHDRRRLPSRGIQVGCDSKARYGDRAVCVNRPPLSCRTSPPQGGRSAGIGGAELPNLGVGERRAEAQSPPLRGRCPAGQRGVLKRPVAGRAQSSLEEAPCSPRS
jgi:hypothetical protein